MAAIEEKIIGLGPHMFIRNVKFEDSYEEYIVDTINKRLLRVKFFCFVCDTVPIVSHDPSINMQFEERCFLQHLSFYFLDNQLIKVSNNAIGPAFYIIDKAVIEKDQGKLRIMNDLNDYEYPKFIWLYSNRFLRRSREPF